MIKSLERLYPYAPVWAQQVGIFIFGLAWRRERMGGDFERHVAGFRERDRWSTDQMQAYLQTELRRVLVHAFDEVPFYRRRWAAAGIARGDLERMTVADLAKLPATPRSEVRNDPENLVARDVARRHKLHRYYSSGSTGTPVTVFCTSDGHRRFIAAREVRSFGWAGTSLRHSRAVIGGRLVVPKGKAAPPFHRYNWVERQVYFSAFHLAPENAVHYVRALNHHRPKVLTGYAYSYYALARLMLEQGLALEYQPEALVLCSEPLTPEMKPVLRQAFHARAFEEYGSIENCVLATECPHGRLHAHPDFGILEIVDRAGQPALPGQEGKILGTTLLNDAQPLIRYEIGDVGVWSAETCPCGRAHLPVVREIAGRLEDVVLASDGRELTRLDKIFNGLPHVLEGQILQESLARIVIKVVAAGDFGPEDERRIRRRLLERVGAVEVQIQPVPEIPRTERGKFRAVVSRLTPQERSRVQPSPVPIPAGQEDPAAVI